MKPTTKSKLERLLKQWRRKERDFYKASRQKDYETPIHRARYEGVSTAFRWCREDIHKIIDEL